MNQFTLHLQLVTSSSSSISDLIFLFERKIMERLASGHTTEEENFDLFASFFLPMLSEIEESP